MFIGHLCFGLVRTPESCHGQGFHSIVEARKIQPETLSCCLYLALRTSCITVFAWYSGRIGPELDSTFGEIRRVVATN